jgi:uncharacterized protein (DUF58 family)
LPESAESKKAENSIGEDRKPGDWNSDSRTGNTGSVLYPRPGRRFFIRPRFSAILLIALSALLLGLGLLRGELALTLPGAAFAAALAYSFAGVLFLAVLHRKMAPGLAAAFVPSRIESGGKAELLFSGLNKTGSGRPRRLFSLPGIVIRYEVHIETRDGRNIRHIFNPEKALPPLEAAYRGAYYGAFDILSVSDISGFFIAGLPCKQEEGARLLVSPASGREALVIPSRSGGERQRVEPSWVRTDDLTDHRPYVSGDDPRRINWKLYGHGAELFVREGEREPPPRSRMAILIDTKAEKELFSAEAGRRMVDRCCEYALALAFDWKDRGVEVSIGYSGLSGSPRSGDPEALAAFLAYPAAQDARSGEEKLPQVPGEEGIVIFLLPRNYSGLLDEFLALRKTAELIFLYENEEQREAAELCARRYGQRGGCHAQCFGV